MENLKDHIKSYWTRRAPSFVEQRLREFESEKRGLWLREISRYLPQGKRLRVLDVGTGTGCIALSFAVERPQCRCTAVDVDEAALSLARENAVRCGVADRVEFRLGRNCDGAAEASLDAVVSNPPYIASRVVDGLPPLIRDHEPRRALDGGADGLDIVREVVNDAAIALRPGGWCFLEIGDEQGEAVRGILEDAGFSRIAVLSDFAGLTRFAKGRIV